MKWHHSAPFIFFASFVINSAGCNDRTLKLTHSSTQTSFGDLPVTTKIGWDLVKTKVVVTCLQCHTSNQQPLFSDPVSILNLANRIKSEVDGDQMPPSSRGYQPLSGCQKAILSTWLKAGAPLEGAENLGTVLACNGQGGSREIPIGQLPLGYQTLLTKVLQPRCLKCHNPDNKDAGGILFYPYSVLTSPGQIERWSKPGASSKVIEMLTRSDENRMPPPEDGAPLEVDEIGFVKAWIDAGMPQ